MLSKGKVRRKERRERGEGKGGGKRKARRKREEGKEGRGKERKKKKETVSLREPVCDTTYSVTYLVHLEPIQESK